MNQAFDFEYRVSVGADWRASVEMPNTIDGGSSIRIDRAKAVSTSRQRR